MAGAACFRASGVRALLERCLQKNPASRLRDIGDLRLQLQALEKEAAAAPRSAHGSAHGLAHASARVPVAAPVQRRKLLWPAVAAAVVLAAVAGAFLYLRPKPAPPEAVRFEVTQPDITQPGNTWYPTL